MTEPIVWTVVANAALAADRNARHRRKMEDAHALVDKLGENSSQAFFAVYDGHGGNGAALYSASNLHVNLAAALKEIPEGDITEESIHSAFKQAYSKTDVDMKEPVPNAGSCAVTALVRVVGDKKFLYIANVGDSRAVLVRAEGKAETLTIDHSVKNQSECDRITSSNGFIINGRVNSMISITRALGDHNMKEWLISEPFFKAVELAPEDSHLILACDGVWDVMSDQAAADTVLEEGDLQLAAKKLVGKALRDGSTDNLSVILVQF